LIAGATVVADTPAAMDPTNGLTTAEREELARLRKENRELRTERNILKKPPAIATTTPSWRAGPRR
jgi:transposase-like protein